MLTSAWISVPSRRCKIHAFHKSSAMSIQRIWQRPLGRKIKVMTSHNEVCRLLSNSREWPTFPLHYHPCRELRKHLVSLVITSCIVFPFHVQLPKVTRWRVDASQATWQLKAPKAMRQMVKKSCQYDLLVLFHVDFINRWQKLNTCYIILVTTVVLDPNCSHKLQTLP